MRKSEIVTKREIEMLIGENIDKNLFEKALEYARRKQADIYEREKREVILERWYLEDLVRGYVISLTLSKVTLDFCKLINYRMDDMEKSAHIENYVDAQETTHIVANSI